MNYLISPPTLRKIKNNAMVPIINLTNKNKYSASLETSRNDYSREFYYLNIDQFIFL